MPGFNMDDYVPVNERIDAFKGTFPDGSLQSEIVELTESRVTVKAYAYRSPDDLRPGIGHSSLEIPGKTSFTKGSEIENAETSAWGRAIAALGFEVKRGLASAEEVRNKQPQDGERDRSTGKRSPAMTRPAVQRSPEEQALADELLALTADKGHEYMEQLADEVGVQKGQRANADQLREMIALAIGHAAGIEPAVGAIAAGDQAEPEVQSPLPPSGSVPPSTEEAIARARRKAAATQKAEQEALPLGAES